MGRPWKGVQEPRETRKALVGIERWTSIEGFRKEPHVFVLMAYPD